MSTNIAHNTEEADNRRACSSDAIDISTAVQTALADQYDVDFMRIAWERHVQTDLLRAGARERCD